MVIDNSILNFEETTEIILCAVKQGIHKCIVYYTDVCRIIAPEKVMLENESGIFEVVNGELVGCRNKTDTIVIPDSAKIQQKVFANCSSLAKICIPRSVRLISTFVFLEVDIETFKVEAENAEFCSVNGVVYDKELRTLLFYPKGKNSIELENVEIIGSCVFQGCMKITENKLKKALACCFSSQNALSIRNR